MEQPFADYSSTFESHFSVSTTYAAIDTVKGCAGMSFDFSAFSFPSILALRPA